MPFTYMPTLAIAYMENSSISTATLQGTLAAGSMAVAQGCVSHPSRGTTSKCPPSSAWKPRVDKRSVSGLWPFPLGTHLCQKVIRTSRTAGSHVGSLGCFLMQGQTLRCCVQDGSMHKYMTSASGALTSTKLMFNNINHPLSQPVDDGDSRAISWHGLCLSVTS